MIGVEDGDGNGAAGIAMTSDRYEERDRTRMAELTERCGALGRCRHCGRKLADVTLERSPGVCSRAKCRRLAIRERKKTS